jgi:uncharacterized membrane protein
LSDPTFTSTAAAGSPVLAAPAGPGVHARRVIFVDLARALAVLFMLYGHAVSALLAPAYQQGTWFELWNFQRGLTSSLFLILAGFAFSVATVRHWASHLQISPQFVRRIRRFAFFILLGYGLHFPVPSVVELATATEQQWRAFLAVDVLQLIGLTFIGVQLLVLVARSRWILTVLALAAAAAVVIATPRLYLVDWQAHLPLWASSYLEPETGSLFPLFPFVAYVLIGVALGQLYGRWGAANLGAFANRVLLLPGLAMIAGGRLLRPYAAGLFSGGPWTYIPPEVLLRVGTCLLLLWLIAHGSRKLHSLPRIFGAVAQETLLIYFVHLCIIYGSIWNPGLAWFFAGALSPLQVLAVVLVLVAAMVGLAYGWNWMKHHMPEPARVVSIAAPGLLLLLLLL